jgi:hypothetical protein
MHAPKLHQGLLRVIRVSRMKRGVEGMMITADYCCCCQPNPQESTRRRTKMQNASAKPCCPAG